MKSGTRNRERWLHAAVSAAILLLLCRFVTARALRDEILHARLGMLLLAAVVAHASLILRAWRWQLILNQHEMRVRLWHAYLLTMVGVALNCVMPANSGEIAKSYYGYRLTGIRELMLSSVIIDKLVALLAAFLIGLLPALALHLYGYATLEIVLSLVFAAAAFCPGVMPWNGVAKFARHFRIRLDPDALRAGAAMTTSLKAAVTMLSLAAWVLTFVQFDLIFASLGSPIALAKVFAVMPLVNIAKLVPFTLDGLGTQEALITFLFSTQGISNAAALAASLLGRLLAAGIPALAGVIVILRLGLPTTSAAPGNKP